MNNSKTRLKFKGSCLKQEDLNTWSRDLNFEFTLKDCFFGSVKLAKDADTGKYKCSSYGMGFDL